MTDLRSTGDQMAQDAFPRSIDDGIDLVELFMVLWAGKWLISAFVMLAAPVAVMFALSQPNIYTASALLAPAENARGGLSGLAQQYGGLARLAGVSISGGEQASQAQLGMQLMKSRMFISDFVERRDILPELMAVDHWDPVSGELIYSAHAYDAAADKWVLDPESNTSRAPSNQQAYKAFVAIMSLAQDRQTGYVTVSIEHQSPVVAAKWINWLVEDVNAAVKEQDVAEAEKSIEYLKQQVESTSLTDLHAMFFELIQSQTETVMLAEVRPEYVFKTIDPAVVPEDKSKPSRAQICILGTMLGGLLGIFTVLFRHYVRYIPKA